MLITGNTQQEVGGAWRLWLSRGRSGCGVGGSRLGAPLATTGTTRHRATQSRRGGCRVGGTRQQRAALTTVASMQEPPACAVVLQGGRWRPGGSPCIQVPAPTSTHTHTAPAGGLGIRHGGHAAQAGRRLAQRAQAAAAARAGRAQRHAQGRDHGGGCGSHWGFNGAGMWKAVDGWRWCGSHCSRGAAWAVDGVAAARVWGSCSCGCIAWWCSACAWAGHAARQGHATPSTPLHVLAPPKPRARAPPPLAATGPGAGHGHLPAAGRVQAEGGGAVRARRGAHARRGRRGWGE